MVEAGARGKEDCSCPCIRRGIRRLELFREEGRRALRALEAPSAVHAAERHEHAAASSLQQIRGARKHDVVHADRNPDLRPKAEYPHAAKAGGGDAGDGELGSVDAYHAADDGRVSMEAPAPRVVAQHGEWIGTLRRVGRREESSECWTHV